MSSLQNLSAGAAGNKKSLPKFPELTMDHIKSSTKLKEWNDDVERWREKVLLVIRGTAN